MKKKEYFYIDVKEKKIKRGKDYIWNTLSININRLKLDKEYRKRCIQKFADIIEKRKEIKPIKIKYTAGRKRYFSSKINNLPPNEYISRTEINIIKRNEETIKNINEIKGL